jgi:hypothetical protein
MISKHRFASLLFFTFPLICFSQENSPYSRYGIGNLSPRGNILNRGMGGISAGIADPATVNSINPASYSNLIYTTLDIGAEVDSRILKSDDPQGKFTSSNAIIPYLQLGIPLLSGNKKAQKNNTSWGLNFGLRPVSKVNYNISGASRLNNIDSVQTLYEGTGGVNEAFAGTGLRIKNFSFGVNAGYLFGNKDYSTRLIFLNDSVQYYKSNSATTTNFGGLFLNGGIQYVINLKNKDKARHDIIRLGAYGNLKHDYNATQNILRETFEYNSATGNPDKIDSVYQKNDQKGKITLPATFGLGFSFENPHVLLGADFEMTNWDAYRFYGQKDLVKNSWMFKAGIQYFPVTTESKSYWNFVKYRAGIYFGPDYITAGNKLPQYGVSLGAAFPLKLKRSFYETQYSVMNMAVEYGNRGNNNNNIKESILRISVGFSLSDVWFRRYKYD